MTHGLQLETRRGGEGEQCDLQKTGVFFFLSGGARNGNFI